MSNASTTPRQSGDPKRRRSRGGRNRNKQSGQDGQNREGQNRDHQHRSGQHRAEEFRPHSDRKPTPAPVRKLSFFQRLLKMIGLYKEPTPPAPVRKTTSEPRAPKSNTRNARTQDRPEPSPRPQESSAKPQEPRPRREKSDRPRGGDRSTVESNRVYVGNLSYDVSEQDLQELFKGLGPVRNVEIVYNRSTHRSKGYGFLEMVNKDEAVRAVEVLHDQFFMGRKLVVSGAKSKGFDEREDQEVRSERPARPMVLAPLPSNTSAVPEIPTLVTQIAEPTIQTIVETVTPLIETPVDQALSETAPPVSEEIVLELPEIAAEPIVAEDPMKIEETAQRQA